MVLEYQLDYYHQIQLIFIFIQKVHYQDEFNYFLNNLLTIPIVMNTHLIPLLINSNSKLIDINKSSIIILCVLNISLI